MGRFPASGPVSILLKWPGQKKIWGVLVMEYELRYRRNDGRIALLFVTSAPDDRAADEIAEEYWKPQYATLEIWRGAQRIKQTRNPRPVN